MISPPPPPPSDAPTTARAAAGAIDATKRYGRGESEVVALDNVTVAFEQSKYTAIMGPSGSGKSTLMHCLAGLDTLTSGAVYIGDTYLSKLNDKELTELRRKSVGFIFQAYNLIPTLTAEENIKLPLMLGGDDGDSAWFTEVVDTVGPVQPPQTPPERALRRPAAARGRGPCAQRPARHHLRRRAHRQPRLALRRRDPRLHAAAPCASTARPS